MSPTAEISSSVVPTSSTAQRRKIKKPLIEKRRRLRINQCLSHLKSLVLEATNKDESCFPKMEKADILEMTVSYLRTIKHRTSTACALENIDIARTYLSGFRECAMEVCSYFLEDSLKHHHVAGVPTQEDSGDLRSELTKHLSRCFQKIQLDLEQRFDGPCANSGTLTSLSGTKSVASKQQLSTDDQLHFSSTSSSSSFSSSSCSSSSPVPLASPASSAEMDTSVVPTPRVAGSFPFPDSSLINESRDSNAKTQKLPVVAPAVGDTSYSSVSSFLPQALSSSVSEKPVCLPSTPLSALPFNHPADGKSTPSMQLSVLTPSVQHRSCSSAHHHTAPAVSHQCHGAVLTSPRKADDYPVLQTSSKTSFMTRPLTLQPPEKSSLYVCGSSASVVGSVPALGRRGVQSVPVWRPW